MAANLDQVVLVASIADPAFSRGLADRIFCQAEHAGLPARLVLNKMDLPPGGAEADAQAVIDDYARAGVAGHRSVPPPATASTTCAARATDAAACSSGIRGSERVRC